MSSAPHMRESRRTVNIYIFRGIHERYWIYGSQQDIASDLARHAMVQKELNVCPSRCQVPAGTLPDHCQENVPCLRYRNS